MALPGGKSLTAAVHMQVVGGLLTNCRGKLKLIFQTLAREKVDITLTDKMGLPADVLFGKGTIDDKKFVPYHIKNTAGKRKKVLNLDMGYMSLSLRRSMRQKKIRVNMGVREQDYRRKRGPKFKFDKQIYYKRLMLERTNGWVKAFRSIKLRRSACPAMFKAMVYMALIIVMIR